MKKIKYRRLAAMAASLLCCLIFTAPAYAQSSEPQPETAPAPAETEAEPETQNPFTPDGTGTVVDNATDEDGKEFYTITTADESVFYLVIDKQKTSENVYFLNTVTTDDLSIAFCISSTVASILCGFVFFGVTDILFKVLFSAVYGLLIAISALPLVLLIVFFSRSYIFSIMLCVFYSVFNLLSTFSMTALPKWLVLTLPTPSIMLWGTQQMSSRTAINDTEDLQNFIQMGLIPSTPQLIITLGVIGAVSLLLAVYLYKKRSE